MLDVPEVKLLVNWQPHDSVTARGSLAKSP
jgi:hypothetical protein